MAEYRGNRPVNAGFSDPLEAELPSSLRRGETKPARTSEDLAGALHEVSNALTVVLGWLAEAREGKDPAVVNDAVQIAYKHAKRGHTVARRAIGAHVDEDKVVRSVLSVAQDAINAATPQATKSGVALHLQAPENDAQLVQAPSALQVLVNLLLNAVSFSPTGGLVTLGLRVLGSSARFQVQDQGKGVAEQVRDSLFTRGQSLRPGGAGIGLSHSHTLAENAGGALRLLPASHGSGACFELEWPIGDEPSQTTAQAPKPSGDDIAGMRVVVLEDDAAVMSMVQFGLQSRGVEVASVATDAELQSIAVDERGFDAALVDLSPIQADPREALDRFRARHGQVPIILISGTAISQAADLALSGWVEKPFELGELYAALASLKHAVEREHPGQPLAIGSKG